MSDSHNIEMAGGSLEHLRKLTLRRIKGYGRYTAPASQNDYWALIFHADSLMDDGLYAEAKQTYDLAFTEDRYILPSHLSTVAMKMMGIHNDDAALDYLSHRVRMEQDFYEEPIPSTFLQLRDTFEVRQRGPSAEIWYAVQCPIVGCVACQRVEKGGRIAANGSNE